MSEEVFEEDGDFLVLDQSKIYGRQPRDYDTRTEEMREEEE